MTSGYILIIICTLFAFSCALIKQLYDAQYYPKNIYVFLIDVILSGLSGVILCLLFSEFFRNELVLLGISGLGGIFGVNGLKMLIKYNLDQKVNLSILEAQIEDDIESDIKDDIESDIKDDLKKKKDKKLKDKSLKEHNLKEHNLKEIDLKDNNICSHETKIESIDKEKYIDKK